MTNSPEQDRPNRKQVTVLLDSTLEAIHNGFSSRYQAFLERVPAILADALTPGEQKHTALESAYQAILGESALGFSSRPVRHNNVVPAKHVSVFRVNPVTGLETPGSRSSIGVADQSKPEALITYTGFTPDDVVFALTRIRQQESVKLIFDS